MDSERDDAKKLYEPPRVLRLDAARSAAGACASGSGDDMCISGNSTLNDCQSGSFAGASCTADGSQAADNCSIGSGAM